MLRRVGKWISSAVALVLLMLLVVSCGPEVESNSNQMNYKDMKSMVIDILGSQEAVQALEKASNAQYGDSTLQMKSMTPADQAQVRLAVKDVLTSPDYSLVLRKIMTDPKFAGEFAKAVSKDNKQIHKDLIKDPSYRQDMMTMFKEPEMTTVLSEAIKSNDVRKQMMIAVTETMKSPLFKLEIMKLLQDVVKQELMPEAEKAKQGEKKEDAGAGASEEGGGSDSDESNGGNGGGQ